MEADEGSCRAIRCDPRADTVEGFVGNIDVEGLDRCHVVMTFFHLLVALFS